MVKGRSSRRSNQVEEVEEEGNFYTVDRIVDYKEDADGPRWRIRWKNYSADDDTWEPRENIMVDDKKLQADIARLQAEYRNSNKRRSSTSPSRNRSSEVRQKAKTDLKSVQKIETKAKPQHETATATRGRASRASISSSASPPQPGRTKVAHIRKIPGRDDDFMCVVTADDGSTKSILVSDARVHYYNELIDYLLKRVRFLDSVNV